LAIWVPSVANQGKQAETSDSRSLARGYSVVLPVDDGEDTNKGNRDAGHLELSVVGSADALESIDEEALEDLKVCLLF